eukprot:COSAG01_NODE_26709_length_705_cov_1.102310_1_plen_103_part_00
MQQRLDASKAENTALRVMRRQLVRQMAVQRRRSEAGVASLQEQVASLTSQLREVRELSDVRELELEQERRRWREREQQQREREHFVGTAGDAPPTAGRDNIC